MSEYDGIKDMVRELIFGMKDDILHASCLGVWHFKHTGCL